MMTLEQACSLYLDIHHIPSGNLCQDLVTAAEIAQRWRTIGPEATATIVHGLREHCGMSEQQVADATGIPKSSVNAMTKLVREGHWGPPEGDQE